MRLPGDGTIWPRLRWVRCRDGSLIEADEETERSLSLNIDHVLYTNHGGGSAIEFWEIAELGF
jgi:hypothetical protein